MRIFYIDWQQNWKYDRTINIGANAHGKRAVSTKQPQVTDLRRPLTVGLSVTSERYWASFTSPQTVSQCDCFTVRPFFAATYVHVFVVWNFTRLITRLERFFFKPFWWGALSSNVFTICALYWSLGRRGYFGISNVVLVVLSNTFRNLKNNLVVKRKLKDICSLQYVQKGVSCNWTQ